MFNICPVRNVSYVEGDIWFITRGINGIFKYSIKNETIEYHFLPGVINSDYMYLATYYYEGKVYIPPVLNKGFIEFDAYNYGYRVIETENSVRKCNFNYSFRIGDSIFCVPNDKEGPFVMFSMREKEEINKAYYFPNSLDSNFIPILAHKVSNEVICGLLSPINTVYFLNVNTGKFSFFQNSNIMGTIESVVAIDDYLYLSTDQEIIVTNLNMEIIIVKQKKSSSKTMFIGRYEDYAFLDVVNEPDKRVIKYIDGDIQEIVFNDQQHNSKKSAGKVGVLEYIDEIEEYIYFNGYSCGFYRFKDITNKTFNMIKIDSDTYINMMDIFALNLKDGNINSENNIFGIKEFIRGISNYGRSNLCV